MEEPQFSWQVDNNVKHLRMEVSTESVTYGQKKKTLQLLFFSYHAHECQDQAQSGRDGEGEEGGELFSSCERCLLASGF